MADPTPAQKEFNDLLAKNNADDYKLHPEDKERERRDRAEDRRQDVTEEDQFRNARIDAAMRIPAFDRLTGGVAPSPDFKLPPASLDTNHSTGVKGVIADARSYEMARRAKWMNAVRTARRSIFGVEAPHHHHHHHHHHHRADSETDGEGSGSDLPDEEAFLQQWRESRRRELESEANPVIRTRRTSPSVRVYGRFDEVDAIGYLDAIEKVGRETVVVVFVYDPDCLVSREIEKALVSLVGNYPTVHFVKVHYEEVEFDNAGVPAILAYRNQGDLFANLTGIMDMIPDGESFGSETLRRLFQKHHVV